MMKIIRSEPKDKRVTTQNLASQSITLHKIKAEMRNSLEMIFQQFLSTIFPNSNSKTDKARNYGFEKLYSG
jgi:hypothetical protein